MKDTDSNGQPKLPAADKGERTKAMLEFIGIRKDCPEAADPVEYIRELRSGDRLERLQRQ